jgi:NodT family efflux transporter outer membrane factor (OMF) lipoprotein
VAAIRIAVPILVLLPLFFVAGCATLGPDFSTPDVPVATDWSDLDPELLSDQPADHPEWWMVFNDPVLNQLIDTAQSQNLTLRSAGVRVLQAQAQLGIATGSRYPQVQQLSGSANEIQLSENGSDSMPLLDDKFGLYNLGFNLAWEVDFWGRFRRMIESSSAQLQAQVARYDAVMVELTAEVARYYVLTRTLERRLVLVKQNIAVQERALQIADVKFRNGKVTELDVQQARTILNKTKSSIPVLETSLTEARNTLAVLLGMLPQDLEPLLNGSAPVPTPPAMVAVGMPQDLIRRRPDIRQAEWAMAAQSAQIGVAVTELYPHFTLGGSIGLATTTIGDKGIGDLFDSGSVSGLLGAGFTWNILNYGRLQNNVRFQDARFQEMLIDYQKQVLTAQAEVDTAIIAYLRAHSQAGYLSESVNAAERSVELSMVQYREGSIDFNQVLNTLTQQTEQQDSLTATQGAIATNLVNLYKVLGGGWQVDGDRAVYEYANPEDQQDMLLRTRYWRDVLPD